MNVSMLKSGQSIRLKDLVPRPYIYDGLAAINASILTCNSGDIEIRYLLILCYSNM